MVRHGYCVVGSGVGAKDLVGAGELVGEVVVLDTGVNDGINDGVDDGVDDGAPATLKLPDVPAQESSAPPLRPPTLHETSLSQFPPHV